MSFQAIRVVLLASAMATSLGALGLRRSSGQGEACLLRPALICWIKAVAPTTSVLRGKDYVSLSLAAPEFGPRRLYANLGRAAGQDDDDAFAIIWNPAD